MTFQWLPADPNAPNKLPFVIKKADLTTAKGNGLIWFDPVTGQPSHTEGNITMQGTLVMTVNGLDGTLDFTQNQKQSSKTTMNSPLPPN
jgi:hypothetical protein